MFLSRRAVLLSLLVATAAVASASDVEYQLRGASRQLAGKDKEKDDKNKDNKDKEKAPGGGGGGGGGGNNGGEVVYGTPANTVSGTPWKGQSTNVCVNDINFRDGTGADCLSIQSQLNFALCAGPANAAGVSARVACCLCGGGYSLNNAAGAGQSAAGNVPYNPSAGTVVDNTPPVDTLPVDTLPVDTPPVETPPVETPPVDTPPATDGTPAMGGEAGMAMPAHNMTTTEEMVVVPGSDMMAEPAGDMAVEPAEVMVMGTPDEPMPMP